MRRERRAMTAERGPLYDAFVVRLWRDAPTGRLLRAEVEHAGTGALARAAEVGAGWVLRQIRACLAVPPVDEAAASRPEIVGAPPPPARPKGP